MIEFHGVTFTYPGMNNPAIKNVNLEIADGSLVLMTGVSGSGKSTLLRCIDGLVPHFSGGVLEGVIRVNGKDPVNEGPQRMSREVGFVFQDPETQFVVDLVEDEIAFALENIGCPPDEMRKRVSTSLDMLEIAPLRRRFKDSLSSGERQKVMIAAALALQPRILLLDEPTSQLDPQSAEEVLQALVRLNQEYGLTLILTEHRLERVLPLVHQMVFLEAGTPGVISGAPRQVLAQTGLGPPVVQLGKELGWQPLPLTVEEAHKLIDLHGLKLSMDGNENRMLSEPEILIEVRGLNAALEGNSVLRGVDLKLFKGEILALMGANGAGKTTFLRTLVGLVSPQAGEIIVSGENIRQKGTVEICKTIAYLPQDPSALLFADRVLDELLITLRNHRQTEARNRQKNEHQDADRLLAMQLLEKLGLIDQAQAYPRDLSVGQRQRVALGAIMVHEPKALLLDEPTRGLDWGAKQRLVELLRAWRSEGVGIVLVTHDVELVAACADRVAIMAAGRIQANGAPEMLLAQAPFLAQMAELFPGAGCLTVESVLQRQL